MIVDVSRSPAGTVIAFENTMPDNSQILSAFGTARQLKNGSLTFDFTDGWGNRGSAVLTPKAVMILEMTKRDPSPNSGNIGRNYVTVELSAETCGREEFQGWKPPPPVAM